MDLGSILDGELAGLRMKSMLVYGKERNMTTPGFSLSSWTDKMPFTKVGSWERRASRRGSGAQFWPKCEMPIRQPRVDAKEAGCRTWEFRERCGQDIRTGESPPGPRGATQSEHIIGK